METKVCSKCKEELPATAEYFGKHSKSPLGLRCTCKLCTKAQSKEYYKRKSEHHKKVQREYRKNNPHKDRERHTKNSYGIDLLGLQILMNKQKGCCSICKESLVTPETTRNYSVDHDHATGKVRGLLCGKCNSAIGLLKEDINILEAAIVYLKVHSV